MQGVYCSSRPMRLSHATAKNKAGVASHSTAGSSIGNGSSRGGTPVQPLGSLLSESPNPLFRSNSTGQPSNLSLQHPQPHPFPPAHAPNKPLPPSTRRLSPNTIEYLSELAAANGGTLPIGPGGQLVFPPLQVKVNEPDQNSYQSGADVNGRGNGAVNIPNINVPLANYNFRPSGHMRSSSREYPYTPSSSAPFSNPQQPSNTFNNSYPNPSRADLSGSLLSTTSLAPSSYESGNNIPAGGGGTSSTDPNNTTVFVGGLSSLISEETLKTFFMPFGEITYVRFVLPLVLSSANIGINMHVLIGPFFWTWTFCLPCLLPIVSPVFRSRSLPAKAVVSSSLSASLTPSEPSNGCRGSPSAEGASG